MKARSICGRVERCLFKAFFDQISYAQIELVGLSLYSVSSLTGFNSMLVVKVG